MMRAVLIVTTTLLLLPVVYCQVYSWGACPETTVQQDFEIDRYLGKWYEYEHFYAIFQVFAPDCVSGEYSRMSDGLIRVYNKGYNKFFKTWNTAEGDAEADPDEPAKLGVKFVAIQPRGMYWVLDTDYSNHTLVYSCTNWFGGWFRSEMVWILTRQRGQLAEETKTRLYGILHGYGVDTSSFISTDQTDCPN